MATATRTKHSKLDHVAINQGLTVVHPDPDQPKRSSGDDIAVDIVAVPGLGASPHWTWRSENKVDWLRDTNMLPRTITNARIMIFEYESQWFGKGSINQRLSSVADQLVQALFHQRSRGSKRPIVFVCHCLGGIVVEKAILVAQLRHNDYPNIFMSVVGCIFLGTPFRGTKSQSKASVLAGMAKTVGLGVNSGLLKLLEEGSETLRDLLSDFSSLAREVNMQLFCFFEQHESDMMNLAIKSSHFKHKELIVEEDSAHIDGYRTGALAADHFGLNKFTGPKDGRYLSVAGEINVTVQKASVILKSRQNDAAIRQSLIDDATYHTILDDLKVTDPQKDMQDSVRGRPASQASWVLANENYVKWKKASTSNVLWIHGNAGKGQPVIACSFINDLEQQTKNQDGVFVAYFFCDEKDARRRTVRDILKLLIRQMIWKNRDLTEYLLVDDEKGKTSGRTSQIFDAIPVAELWRRLQSMLSDAMVDKVYFLINAFEETDRDSRKEFLQLLAPYIEPRTGAGATADESSVKWIFLSRSGRPDIEKSFQRELLICTEDKENAGFVNDGVKREISGQVDELAKLKNFNDALSYLIKRYLYQKADGNYIYAQLVVQELKNLEPSQVNISTIRKFLEDLPYGLTDVFEFFRKRVLNPNSEGIEYTKEIFRCLTLAMVSPTLSELALIADLPFEVRDDKATVEPHVRRCGAFVTISVDEHGYEIVEWIDIAAKEHLMTYAKDQLSLDLREIQHGIIALRCLEHVRSFFAVKPVAQDNAEINPDEENPVIGTTYDDSKPGSVHGQPDLEGKESHTDTCQAEDASTPIQDQGSHDETNEYLVEQPQAQNIQQSNRTFDDNSLNESEASYGVENILHYAVGRWIEHAMQSPVDIVEEFDLGDEFWSQDSLARANWWYVYSDETKYAGVTGLTPLHLAALTGFSALLNHLLEKGPTDELQKVDSWGYTPLAWACDLGDIRMVDRLLKAGANVNIPRDAGGPTALWAAAFCGHTDIVQYLIEHNAEVDTRDEERGTALYVAASGCSPEIVRELLQQGADVNLRGGWHIRPINVAAYSGYTDIVTSLLQCEIEVDPDDEYRYGSALGAAARRGHAEIIRILLQKGWNVNRKLKTYDSPLIAAATYGHTEAVKSLLQQEIQGVSKVQALEVASKNGRTEVVKVLLQQSPYLPHQKAFHNAATYGRDDILELLQKLGTNSEMLNMALYDASDQERESTVNLLVKFGASPDAEGKEYGNALQAATYDGSTGIVQSLLANNADVNKRGGNYGTALQAAALYGHIDIVQILLNHGAHVNTETIGRYGSALQAACWSGRLDLVELLVARGADVNSIGGIYGSPIVAAVDESMRQILEFLVNHGADVNVKDARDEKPTLLVLAGYTLGKESLELLLDHRADIEGTDDDGVTVLISAADSGDKESLAMLIDRGAKVNAVSKLLGTALSAAASEGDEECCKVLLDNGADVNQNSGEWGTALQAAAAAADLDCINMLLDASADVNQIGGRYGCSLQAAAYSGNAICLQRLLEMGAHVNTAGGDFGCPLQAAAIAGHHQCLQALLDHGADANIEGGMYHSSLQAAAAKRENYDCVKTLLDHGANTLSCGGLYGSVMQAAAVGQNLDLWDLLLDHGVDLHAKGGKYGGPLQAAALKSGIEFVLRLLDQAVTVNEVSGKYGTALQAAAFANDAGVTKVLLEHDANPQLGGGHYGNALNAAACKGNTNVLNLLLDQALPVEMLDEALVKAVYHRQDSVVDILLKKGASVEARDEVLGSALDALQKEAPNDFNSDDEGDEYEDEESDGESDDAEEEETGGNDIDDGSSQGVTNDQDSVADFTTEDSATPEGKIQKYLDDALAKIRRNPSLRRPLPVKRKLVSPYHEIGGVIGNHLYDVPQQPVPASGVYQTLSDRWRGSQLQPTRLNPTGAYGQVGADTSTTGQYAGYSNRPQVPQAYNSHEQQPQTEITGSNTQPSDPLRPSQAQDTYWSGTQQPPPIPPKSDLNSYNESALSAPQPLTTSHQNQYLSTTRPPPKPPRPVSNNRQYQAYTPNPQPPPYTPQQLYQSQQPPNSNGGSPPYSSYAQHPAPTQPPYANNSSADPPPFPPRPGPSTNQSTDSLDFARLQEKASKFGASLGKFWK